MPRSDQRVILTLCYTEQPAAIDNTILLPPTNGFVLSSRTGGDGRFEFTNLNSGCYIVNVSGSQLEQEKQVRCEYYDVRIELYDGSTANIVIKPKPVEYFQLQVELKTLESNLPISAAVQFLPAESENGGGWPLLERTRLVGEYKTNPNGQFNVANVPEGNYEVWLSEILGLGYSIPLKFTIGNNGNVQIEDAYIKRLLGNGIKVNFTVIP
jgi:hypothetical protein